VPLRRIARVDWCLRVWRGRGMRTSGRCAAMARRVVASRGGAVCIRMATVSSVAARMRIVPSVAARMRTVPSVTGPARARAAALRGVPLRAMAACWAIAGTVVDGVRTCTALAGIGSVPGAILLLGSVRQGERERQKSIKRGKKGREISETTGHEGSLTWELR
jgi:hypothetical protein